MFTRACYNSDDAARILGISDRQLQLFVRRGQLRKFALGVKRNSFLATDLARFVIDRA
jgi:hypothetical protein